jgi:hypothetical protein
MNDIRLAYTSRSDIGARSDEICAIERASLRNNARLGVTGGLYYDGERFFQVLEGREDVVALLFERIRSDPRHRDIALVCRHPISHRMFGLWAMKFVSGIDEPAMRATFHAAAGVSSPSGQSLDPRIETLQNA